MENAPCQRYTDNAEFAGLFQKCHHCKTEHRPCKTVQQPCKPCKQQTRQEHADQGNKKGTFRIHEIHHDDNDHIGQTQFYPGNRDRHGKQHFHIAHQDRKGRKQTIIWNFLIVHLTHHHIRFCFTFANDFHYHFVGQTDDGFANFFNFLMIHTDLVTAVRFCHENLTVFCFYNIKAP